MENETLKSIETTLSDFAYGFDIHKQLNEQSMDDILNGMKYICDEIGYKLDALIEKDMVGEKVEEVKVNNFDELQKSILAINEGLCELSDSIKKLEQPINITTQAPIVNIPESKEKVDSKYLGHDIEEDEEGEVARIIEHYDNGDVITNFIGNKCTVNDCRMDS